MKNKKEYCSFWYTRFQGLLYLLALLTAGLGDAITGLWMIEQHGLMREGNVIVRFIISYYGTSNFFAIKLWFTLFVLLAAVMIQMRSYEPVYWMINGYLASFIIAGTLAVMLNLQAAANEPLFILPQHVILIFISSVVILTNIGEVIDRTTRPRVRSYFDCAMNDLMMILAFIDTFERKSSSENAPLKKGIQLHQ